MRFENIRSAVVAGLTLILPVAPLQAQAIDPLGPLRPQLQGQILDGWSHRAQDPWFILENVTLSQSEQVLSVPLSPLGNGTRQISMGVALDSQQPGAALGLMIQNSQSRDLCLLDLTAAKDAVLLCVIGGKAQELARAASAGRMDGGDVLSLTEDARATAFFLNGSLIGEVPRSTIAPDSAGLMAYDIGKFAITAFTISGGEAAPGSAPSGAAGGMERLGPLAGPINDTPDSNGWSRSVEGGALYLDNPATGKSTQILTHPTGPMPAYGRVFTLQAGIAPPRGKSAADSPYAAIGIIIDSVARKEYCVGEITAQNLALALCFSASGEVTEIGRLEKAAKLDGSDVIEFYEVPGAGMFMINGEVFARLDDHPALEGEKGVLAYDPGLFQISSYGVADLPPPAPAQGGTGDQGSAAPTASDPAGATLNGLEQRYQGIGPVPEFNREIVTQIGVYQGIAQSIFMHELGHALINELQLPSTGPEEDAVDIFSALKLVDPTMYEADDEEIAAMGREAAIYAALQWYYSGMRSNGEQPQGAWQDEHTADLKRFRNSFCVIYGGNPGLFGQIAEGTGMQPQTLGRCEEEFNKQSRAWRTILAPHIRVGAWNPEGLQPADAPGAAIIVNFEPSKYRIGQFYHEAFSEAVGNYIRDLAKVYVLPRDLTVTYRDCDQLNAWYDPREGSITMCYELLANLVIMVSDIEQKTSGGWTGISAPAATGSAAQSPGTGPGNQQVAPSGNFDEAQDFGVPPTMVLFPAPYNGPTPVANMRATGLTTAELVELLRKDEKILLIDTSRGSATIPGAAQIPDAGRDGSLTDSFQPLMIEFLLGQTEGSSTMPIVFFGQGLNDRSSYNAALRAGAGKLNAYWYRGGIEAWLGNGLTLEDVQR